MSASGATILIVEDHDSLRRILVHQLRAAGLNVADAGSAEEATEILADGLRPAVVLLDVNLPGETGWDFLRGPALAASGSPPVLVTSATAVSPALLRELDVAGFLPKPCPMDTILEAVQRLLQRESSAPTP